MQSRSVSGKKELAPIYPKTLLQKLINSACWKPRNGAAPFFWIMRNAVAPCFWVTRNGATPDFWVQILQKY